MRRGKTGYIIMTIFAVGLIAMSSVCFGEVSKIICVPWQGDPLKFHTAISGQTVKLKGVIKATDTSQVWYKWVFGDGSESGVTALNGNLKYLEAYIAEDIPELEVIHPEGSYLVWIDCRKLGLDTLELRRLMFEQAKVYLDDGFIFGPEGDGFERINIACPRKLLGEALDRIKQAIGSL